MPLNRIPEFPYLLAEMMNQIPRQQRLTPIYLGGTSGSGGGVGQPPGGFIGQLPQAIVTYDTDEFALTSGSGSLVDNLNHIRHRVQDLETGGSGGSVSGIPTRIPYFDTATSLGSNKDFLLTFDTTGSPILVLGSHNNLSSEYGFQARLQIISNNPGAGFTSFSFSDTASLGGFYTLGHSGGTRAAPTPVLSGFALGRTNYLGTVTSGSTGIGTTSARIEAIAAENFTTGSQGTYLSFSATRPNTASLTQAVRIDYNRLVLGVSGVYPDTGIPSSTSGIIAVSDSTRAAVSAISYGTNNTPLFQGYRARGTSGSPTAVQNTDILFEFDGNGHDGTSWSGIQALIQGTANENWSATNHGTTWKWYTTPNGSTTLTGPVMQVDTTGLNVSGGFNLGSVTGAGTGVAMTSGSIYSKVDGIGGGFAAGAGGGIVQLYRNAADVWRTPDSLVIDGSLTVSTSGSASGNITSGTYTPTLTNGTNATGSTAYAWQYIRVGTVVNVSGRIGIDPTVVGFTQVLASLPIPSNLTGTTQCSGVFSTPDVAGNVGIIEGDTVGDRAAFSIITTTLNDTNFHFTFQYLIA